MRIAIRSPLLRRDEELPWDGEAERLRSFQVDHQVEFSLGCSDRNVGGFLAFENACHICAAEAACGTYDVRAVAHRPAGRRELPKTIHRWNIYRKRATQPCR